MEARRNETTERPSRGFYTTFNNKTEWPILLYIYTLATYHVSNCRHFELRYLRAKVIIKGENVKNFKTGLSLTVALIFYLYFRYTYFDGAKG